MSTKTLFFVGLILCATGVLSPAIALLLGLIYGFSFVHPYDADSRTLSKFLLQASVVGLGFGMNLQEVIRTERSGFLYTAAGIAFALTAGLLLGRLLDVKQKSSALISVGTAICGGSAIAAVAPILQADEQETAVSLGTIFILNSIALLIFPSIGRALHMSEQQFGLWSALAIHDTSSVVGAASHYGPIALVVGTTVKLTRALWIIPVALGAAAVHRSKNRLVIEVDQKGNLEPITTLLEKQGYDVLVEQDPLLRKTELCYVYAIRPSAAGRLLRQESGEGHVRSLPPVNEEVLTPASLRKFLKDRLPQYMVPSQFVLMEKFPLTANGKIDRQAFPRPAHENVQQPIGEFVRPQTETEKALALIWSEMLKVDNIGINDDFFRFGRPFLAGHPRRCRAFGTCSGWTLLSRPCFKIPRSPVCPR